MSLSLRPEEKAAFDLRELYSQYGYSCYRMSKFEEYDFYAKNKEFLISQGIITFTDVNGRLMALKPDVTLSIIKHIRDVPGITQKFFYDEKVYRVSRNARAFREITQVGLECIGSLDDYCLCEVLELALESLHVIAQGQPCILDVSNVGLLAEIIPEESRQKILKLVAEKNSHEIKNLNIKPDKIKTLVKLIELDYRPEIALPELEKISEKSEQFRQLERVVNALQNYQDEIRMDFSVVSDLNYYNGIVFRGFIRGIPESILSGGQYDNLMLRMGHKSSQAIGFAVYLDLLNQFGRDERKYDVDTVLLYNESSPSEVMESVQNLIKDGERVVALKSVPENLKFKRLVKIS